MRLNNQIQTRLNASYTKNNVATRNDVWPKRGVFLIVPKEHSLHSDLSSRSPFTSSHNCQFCTFLVPLTFLLTLHIFLTMMMIDHDAFLPAVVMTSYTPCCINISSQYDGTHYDDNTAQHGDRYNSTSRTQLPLPVDSTRTSEFNVTVHNDKLLDSAHYTTSDISTSLLSV